MACGDLHDSTRQQLKTSEVFETSEVFVLVLCRLEARCGWDAVLLDKIVHGRLVRSMMGSLRTYG